MEEKKKKYKGKYLYMTADRIEMYVIPKGLVGKYSYRELTGGLAISKKDFEDGTHRVSEEPAKDFTATATYNFKELQRFFKAVKALSAKYITISMKTDDAIKILAENDDGEYIIYWLAAYLKD